MKILGKRFKQLLLISWVWILIAPLSVSVASDTEMVFGVYSEGKPAYYDAYWEKLVEQIALESGQKIRFESAESAEEFDKNG